VNYFQISSIGILPFMTAIFPGNCEKIKMMSYVKKMQTGPKTEAFFKWYIVN